MESKISVGDICQVFPHDSEWERIGSIPVDDTESVVWIPKGSHVLITNILTNSIGEVGWCHAMFNGRCVEISSDLISAFYEI